MEITIQAEAELFRFESFQDWKDNARERFKRARVGDLEYICVDAKGRLCRWGQHFRIADEEGACPVIVYRLDPALDGDEPHHSDAYCSAAKEAEGSRRD